MEFLEENVAIQVLPKEYAVESTCPEPTQFAQNVFSGYHSDRMDMMKKYILSLDNAGR